jgi:hypothetical protein
MDTLTGIPAASTREFVQLVASLSQIQQRKFWKVRRNGEPCHHTALLEKMSLARIGQDNQRWTHLDRQ